MQTKQLRALVLGVVAAGMATGTLCAQVPGLQSQDVGFPSLLGSTTFANGKYTIVGGGNDIWGNSDNFHYAFIEVTGDFDYIVKVEDLQGPDPWTKAELMAREAMDFGSLVPQGDDRHISTMTTRSAGQNEVALQWRSDARASGSGWANDIGITAPLYRPTYPDTWLRLERVGSRFWGYASQDGTTWTELRASPYDFNTLNGTETTPRTDGNMANKLLIGMAVTAHLDTDLTGGIGVFSGFTRWTPVPIQITTQPPATVAASANSTLTITAAATGDPVHYQWLKDGVEIPGGIQATYTKPLVQVSDSGSYTVRCYGAGQTPVVSTATIVTITVDTTPPTIVEAVGNASFTNVRLTFSEPVTAPTATTPGNYQIAGLAVTGATLSADGFSVILTTARQAEGTEYTIAVSNVQDGGGNAVAAGTTVAFKSFSFLLGSVAMELWNDVAPVTSLATFIQHRIGYEAAPETPTPADSFTVQPGFETPNWANGENYGGRLYGWFIPPTTGDYIFYCCSDDASFLMLSSNEDPANKRKIASEASWDNQRSWNGNIRTDASDNGRGSEGSFINRSDQWFDTEWGSTPGAPAFQWTIRLTAGQRYYIEGLWKEGGGGDGFGATYRLATETDSVVVNGDASRITGNLIGAYVDTSKLPPTITAPTGNQWRQVNSGETVTWTVSANNPAAGALEYQWTLNGRDIPGANGPELVLANVDQRHMGQYVARVSNANSTVETALMNLKVLVPAAGVFAIEAEDYDNNGQAVAAVSQMPYLGAAYEGIAAVHGVDYNHNENIAETDWAPIYRSGAPVTGPTQSPFGNDTTQETANMRAQGWQMTTNYKIGWVGAGDWGNYTRTFPATPTTYNVFVSSSQDSRNVDAISHDIGRVTAGVGTTTQTVEPIGSFRAPGSGGWSRNNMVAMLKPTPADPYDLATVELSGTVTIRWSQNSGDADFLLFIPAAAAGPEIGGISRAADGDVVIEFTGALQSSDSVNGTYSDVTPAPTSPYKVAPSGAQKYYRSRN